MSLDGLKSRERRVRFVRVVVFENHFVSLFDF